MTKDQNNSGSMKSGFVALAGLPNVGKSTLMNALLGQKISIATSKPQTTRNRILGVNTLAGRGQVIYVDTPGLHKPHKALNAIMVDNAMASIGDTDVVLYIVDAAAAANSKGPLAPGDQYVSKAIAGTGLPVILAINKIDRLPSADNLLPIIEAYGAIKELDLLDIVPISALDGTGLEGLEEVLLGHLPEGPMLYPEDMITDQAERFIAAEFIREKLTLQTRREIPYSSAVVVEDFQDNPRKNLIRIRALIFVEHDSQKGIVIGKGGARLKQIGSQARADLERFFDRKIYLELHVKVAKNWAGDARALERLGYTRQE